MAVVIEDVMSYLDEEDSPMEWLVDGLIPLIPEPVMIAGLPGAGKSILGQYLCMAVSVGHPVLGNRTRKASTLYLSYEDSRSQVLHRAKLTMGGWQERDGRCGVIYGIDDVVTRGSKGLVKGSGYAELKDAIREKEAELVVIDHLSCLYDGDENDRAQVNQFRRILVDLCRETGCMVIVLAHANKGGQYSGSTANAGMYRHVMTLSSGKGGTRVLRTVKSNYVADDRKRVSYRIDRDTMDLVPCDRPDDDTLVLSLMSDSRWHTRAEIESCLGREYDSAVQFGRAMSALGLECRPVHDKATGKSVRCYRMTDDLKLG